jgi:hypothetical protein
MQPMSSRSGEANKAVGGSFVLIKHNYEDTWTSHC